MNEFLTEQEKELLSDYVRPETLEPCYKQLGGGKDKLPHFERPNIAEINKITDLIGGSPSEIGLRIGLDRRKISRWQGKGDELPYYSQWVLLCILAANKLKTDRDE